MSAAGSRHLGRRSRALAIAGLAALAGVTLLGPERRAVAQDSSQQGLGGHDSSLPIEIVSDRLVVQQEQQLATFYGNVDAVQGDVSLRSDELRVYYTRDQERRADAAGDDQSIRRIEAEGNVLLTSPRETAQGRTGVYQVPEGLVSLEGDVVLTRDKNVVRGTRLDINLRTGVSTVTGGGPSKPGTPREQRVRALFVPAQDEPQPAGSQP